MTAITSRCFAAPILMAATLHAHAGARVVVEWFPEPVGLRVVNEQEVAGVIRNDSNNMDVTQTFTVTSSGILSAVGFALGFTAGARRTASASSPAFLLRLWASSSEKLALRDRGELGRFGFDLG